MAESDQDKTVFNENKQPKTNENQFSDLLNSIEEDGKPKYATVEAAINSIAPAQSHIKTLEEENQTLRLELEKRKTVEEVIEGLKKEEPSKSEERLSSNELDVNKIAEIIDNRINAKDQAVISQQNVAKVIDKMTEVYGDKAEEQFIKTAQDNGISIEDMNRLAAKSPKMVLKLSGIGGSSSDRIPQKTSGNVNTNTLQPTNEPQSLKFKQGGSISDMVNVWKEAGKQVREGLNG